MKNKLVDLRNHLFATIEALADPDTPMDIARARAISEVAQTIIESAKVEVDFARVTGETVVGGLMEECTSLSPAAKSTPRLVAKQ